MLIDERDGYLAQKIRETEGKKIVAVVGAGHIVVQFVGCPFRFAGRLPANQQRR